MTQEDRQLLLKDLCGRLPYGVKVYDTKSSVDVPYMNLCHVNGIINEVFISSGMICRTAPIEDIKPYLFSLSSMNEEQKEEYCQLQQKIIYNSKGFVNTDIINYINWCYKNHLDVNGLISLDLAIDATNKNIY